jgi:uncharacterized protein YjbI with pentapeptide repeats
MPLVTLSSKPPGLVIIGGAAFTALGLWYTARTVETTQESQITDRYTKAVEQLGSGKQDVRLGGIYALQRLAGDSPRDKDTIRNVLAAFVRTRDFCPPRAGQKTPPAQCTSHDRRTLAKIPLRRLDEDVFAALTIAPRLAPRDPANSWITVPALFSGAFFPRVNLIGADLSDADLRSMSVVGTDLSYAKMSGADLSSSDLSYASLRNSDLSGAALNGATLIGANLYSVDLSGATLDGVELGSANLSGSNLHSAVLSGAFLTGADLTASNLNSAALEAANLYRADLRGADLRGADLRGAYLSNANLRVADLRGADLSDVQGMTEREIRGMATVDAHTRF